MKAAILSAVFVLASAMAAHAADLPTEKTVQVAINDVFVPGGFDSNSDVFVVASGLFPNGCYRWKNAEVSYDTEQDVHNVKPLATVSQGMCIMVLVPFTKEIHLGQLDSGEHKVRFLSGDGTYLEKTISIE